jgi:hypothetical protein
MKLKTKFIYIIIAGIAIFASCDNYSNEFENNYPFCFDNIIMTPDTNDYISKIIQYDYNGEKVYLLYNSMMIADYGPLLYDKNCNLMCFSGVAGWQATDTTNVLYCDSFITLSENPIVVWEKP